MGPKVRADGTVSVLVFGLGFDVGASRGSELGLVLLELCWLLHMKWMWVERWKWMVAAKMLWQLKVKV